NHPADLPAGTLSIEDVYTRQGIRMTNTGGDDVIPVAEAGGGAPGARRGRDGAMQGDRATGGGGGPGEGGGRGGAGAAAAGGAGESDQGHGLGGIMFDDMGAAQRQGCAIFANSFIADPPPAGDPNPVAFVERMKFWTACHEIGHTFNLAHSWQKSLGAPYGSPWVPLVDDNESRTFMSYHYRVSGGTH